MALVLNAEFRGRGLVRAAILIPWAIPTIVSAKMWVWMLNDEFGIITDIMLNLGLISQKVAWTANIETAMLAVIVVDVRKTTPFVPRRAAEFPAGHPRGRPRRRHPPGEGVLPGHPAATDRHPRGTL